MCLVKVPHGDGAANPGPRGDHAAHRHGARQRVIVDADLAALYGVETKRFNEAVKRNLASSQPT
jgi:ORF6N domain